MQIFEKTITVVKDDLDQLNHVNNVRYVQWVQDVAEAHWTKRAPKQMDKNTYRPTRIVTDIVHLFD